MFIFRPILFVAVLVGKFTILIFYIRFKSHPNLRVMYKMRSSLDVKVVKTKLYFLSIL